jgi:glycine/D-amino acid oxidase-like deaminating enzyme
MTCTDGTNLSLPCDNVVIAAGPWTGPLSKSLLPTPIPITPYAGHSVVLRPSAKVTEDCLFMTLNTQHSSYPEIFPRPGGEIYIGGVNDNLALPPTPEDVVLQERDLKKLRDIADEIFTDYTIEKEQLCFRPMTESATPFISPVPEVSGAYVGAGHSYSGIMLGPGTGKVLSEMVLGKELSADVSQLKLK